MDQQIIRAALQQEPADLLLKGGKVLNVFSGTIEEKDVLIKNGRIAYVGKCDPKEAKETVDLSGKSIAVAGWESSSYLYNNRGEQYNSCLYSDGFYQWHSTK